ncbi:LysM peptidoglycan-binding domain-containing protein [Halalkalibacter alkaliphilus]|uniref:LysM peptidoglycan-binding domain-containing protein n=1 Tax=Halalkalibacter alkaliphilus TaxID=2917993 RepID=A0A9X1ZWC8_9BACI|nr:LysM peptidoglycan-binding domain-containing protein [Halalkalibacter alkaliphilus]MCL7746724.1 LysM peptidoglycan-binding domain-containing protein [Halalkalibacter alkaliphilus]
MSLFDHHQLKEENGELVVYLYVNPATVEFSKELGEVQLKDHSEVREEAERYVITHSLFRVKTVKVVVGSFIVVSFLFSDINSKAEASTTNAIVATSQIESYPTLFINGQRITQLQQPAILMNRTIYVPLREITETLGGTIWRDTRTNTTGIEINGTTISFVVGSNSARVNGQVVPMTNSIILNGRTMIPVRFLGDSLGMTIERDARANTVGLSEKSSQTGNSSTYTVVAGDTLSTIASRFNTTVATLRQANNLTSDVIFVGQVLKVTETSSPSSTQPTSTPTTYTVVSGDTLSGIASRFNTTAAALRQANNLTSDMIFVGQVLTINGTSTPSNSQATSTTAYTVVAGDTLFLIANRFNTTVNALRQANNLTSDTIRVGQVLTIPSAGGTPSNNQAVTKTETTHTVRSGDTMWGISLQYGIPFNELLSFNNMSDRSTLSVGQTIRVPVYHVPIRPVVSERHGELLDWWTEARYVFSTGKVATITDFDTGRTFQVRHTMGGNHADSEPLTARDAQIMREIWGGSYSWTPRAIIVEVDGRKLAAAMHSFPHGDQVIRDNNYNGHFCIHFLNSQRHNDGQVQESMQTQVIRAAGR